jgi:predicted nucleic acid-binding protein
VIVVADTSGIIAASDRKAPESVECRRILASAGTVIISPIVIAEVDHLAKKRFGSAARHTIMAFLLAEAQRLRFHFPPIDAEMLGRAVYVRRRYAALDLALADAVNVVIAADYHTDRLLTLDRRDFRAIQPLSRHGRFRLLPDDL